MSTETQVLRTFSFLGVAERVRAAQGSQAARLDKQDYGDALQHG